MKIEEEIKVKSFSSDWQRASINIMYTGNWLNLILEKRAAKKQITLQQFNVLRILRGQLPNPSTNNLLKNRMITNTPDISRLVDRIVAKGLVSRCKNKEDKRAVDLFITEKGLALLEEIEDDMMLNDLLPQNLSEQEAFQLSELLDKFRGSIPPEEV
ncbi:MarR family winged helix-turn-helix transcriptional regulator [Sphingobacterium psychroaquaticum]|uniref:DNA-binding transcriptional regulator, MarR family n=1 Tax=Sphingobacterium psychroaquaticum TaxID=561061 RepID=A0A1X7JN47_9SPHI|nr:MarR family transcriptional regulator [Sphingobacterium psychroaquaticum]QBQ40897.1 MarR family transcriptional regulator [Sphingobacterium psychroaquaticum]SMG29656.1 DNA-binding transcriptional regulator, MarR family [Sphingobacterium psychroaquaticum]